MSRIPTIGMKGKVWPFSYTTAWLTFNITTGFLHKLSYNLHHSMLQFYSNTQFMNVWILIKLKELNLVPQESGEQAGAKLDFSLSNITPKMQCTE